MTFDKYVPPGWDEDKVYDGLHKAMGFGRPNATTDQATFYFRKLTAIDADEADASGVPYDFDEPRRNTAGPRFKTSPCVVEFFDAQGQIETFGTAKPTKIKITILQADYEPVKDFVYVMANGDKYKRGIEEPLLGFGTIDVHVIWCNAEGEH